MPWGTAILSFTNCRCASERRTTSAFAIRCRFLPASVRGSRPPVSSPYACSLSEADGQPALTVFGKQAAAGDGEAHVFVRGLAPDQRCVLAHGQLHPRSERLHAVLFAFRCRFLQTVFAETVRNALRPLDGDKTYSQAKAGVAMLEFRKHRITPLTLRHTTAMHLLQSGVEVNVIRSWLGHASTTTTNGSIEIDLTMKRRALETCAVAGNKDIDLIWQSQPDILSWLDSL
jgi:Phage integrase family